MIASFAFTQRALIHKKQGSMELANQDFNKSAKLGCLFAKKEVSCFIWKFWDLFLYTCCIKWFNFSDWSQKYILSCFVFNNYIFINILLFVYLKSCYKTWWNPGKTCSLGNFEKIIWNFKQILHVDLLTCKFWFDMKNLSYR